MTGGARRATRRDAARVAVLWAELIDHHADLDGHYALRPGAAAELSELVEEAVGRADAAVFVWEERGELAGFCAARVVGAPPLLDEPRRGEITELLVRPDSRRRGLGGVLVEQATGWLESRGVRRVEVRVAARNDAAQAFWRGLGYAALVDVLSRRL